MRGISIDNGYDIHVGTDRNLAMSTDKECCRQSLLLASYMLLNENPLNTQEGVPYLETLFQRKRPFEFEQALRSELAKVPNVSAITNVTLLQLDDVLQYEVTAQTTYGPVSI